LPADGPTPIKTRLIDYSRDPGAVPALGVRKYAGACLYGAIGVFVGFCSYSLFRSGTAGFHALLIALLFLIGLIWQLPLAAWVAHRTNSRFLSLLLLGVWIGVEVFAEAEMSVQEMMLARKYGSVPKAVVRVPRWPPFSDSSIVSIPGVGWTATD
jgi:hypothetical protein